MIQYQDFYIDKDFKALRFVAVDAKAHKHK